MLWWLDLLQLKPDGTTVVPQEDDKIVVENINVPGRTTRVNRAKYNAMHKALLRVLPRNAPGVTVAEAKAALLNHLPQDLFPAGATAGWWLKTVQLDLEAKKVIARADKKPLHLYKLKQKK